MITIDVAVRDDQHVVACPYSLNGAGAQCRHARFNPILSPCHWIGDVQLEATKLVRRDVGNATDLSHVLLIQHGLGDFKAQRRVDVVDIEQVGLGADKRHQRHHQLFADGVDRRVGHLGKELAEIVVERFSLAG